MEDLTNIKLIAVFVLLFIALSFGVLPIFFIVRSSSLQDPERRSLLQRIIAFLNAFAGGVFMGISLIHLLPEVRTLLGEAFEQKGEEYNFNWAELCTACGFFMVVFVEQMVNICQDRLDIGLTEEEVPFASQGQEDSLYVDRGASPMHHKTSPTDGEILSESDQAPGEIKKRRSSAASSKSVETSSSRTVSSCNQRPTTLEELAYEQGYLTAARAVILLISLSLHSIFEGLALGLQLTKKDLTDIFIAIALHKGIEAFTIALSFAQIRSTLKLKYLSTIFFAFMSPVGIAIGIPIALSSEDDSGDGSSATGKMINGVLQGLATGTFMFVTFIEILPHELSSKKDAFTKFLFIIVGFTAITLLNALE